MSKGVAGVVTAFTYTTRASAKGFAVLQGPVLPGSHCSNALQHGDVDLGPASLVEEQDTVPISRSIVQRQKDLFISISVWSSLLMPHIWDNEEIQGSPGANVCWCWFLCWLIFFFPECNNKNREIYTKSNIYSPQIYCRVIAKLDYTTTSYL